jgi:hypothetical protein
MNANPDSNSSETKPTSETYQRGYRRGKEVFRSAKVVVNAPSQAEAGSSDDDDLVPQMPPSARF